MGHVFRQMIRRELLIAMRRSADIFNPLWFLVIVITLFPLGLGPEPKLLARVGPAILWVAALLSSMLSLERLFRDDYGSGALETMLLSPWALSWLMLAKVCAHWLLTALPLLLLSPLLAVLLSMEWEIYRATAATLLAGTPVLSLVGAIGGALTVSLKRGGVLLSLLVLPLYIPVLIFATGAIEAASAGVPYTGQLLILVAMSVAALTLAPFAIAAALRVNVN